jgi:hypothetical protein
MLISSGGLGGHATDCRAFRAPVCTFTPRQLDREGRIAEAKQLYVQGCEALMLAVKSDPDPRRKAVR